MIILSLWLATGCLYLGEQKMKTNDLTHGSIGKGYILFAIPLFLGSLFQQLYNTVDMLFVGNVLGKNAAAAVGASSILVTCLINLFTGVAVGAGIVISQLFGARKEQEMKEAVWIAVLAGIAGGLCLTVISVTCSQAVLVKLHTPEAIIPDAVLYVQIYFLSAVPMVLYNMCSGILRAQGDSRTPFHALAAGGIVNVIMDAVFLIVLGWGVAGVAVATLFSQSMTAIFLLVHMLRYKVLTRQRLRWDLLGKIISVGVPVGIQSMILTLSNVVVQYHINGFGENVIAAFAVYFKAENLLCLPIIAFGQAMVTFTGQNYGAGRYDRIRKGILVCNGISAMVLVVLSWSALAAGKWILGAFCPDQAVIAEGLRIIGVTFPVYFIYSLFEVTGGVVRGIGKSVPSMIIVIVNLCLIRILLLEIVDRAVHSVEAVAALYPVTWLLATVSFVIYYLHVRKEMLQ